MTFPHWEQWIIRKLLAVYRLSPPVKRALVFLFTAVLLGIAYIHALYRFPIELGLFSFMYIIGICILFQFEGLWMIPFALIAYHFNQHIVYTGDPGNLQGALVNDGIWFLNFLAVGGVVSLATSSFLQVEQQQEILHADLELANRVQRHLMPTSYSSDNLTVDTYLWQNIEVGGDFLQIIPMDYGPVAFCVGDVMGKGVAAALLTSMIMVMTLEYGRILRSPAKILKRLNDKMMEYAGREVGFFTSFYGIVDHQARSLTFSKAGHHDALLVRNHRITPLSADGLPIGILDNASFEEKQVSLQLRDKIVVFTDGVIDTKNSDGEFFGLDRLYALVEAHGALAGAALCDAIVTDIHLFAGSQQATDDVAILVVDVTA